jgi:hypothetical protein
MKLTLHKKILDNNTQELRHSLEGFELPFCTQINNIRSVSESAVTGYEAHKYTALFRIDSNLINQNGKQIELKDSIEVNGVKRIVSYIEEAPNKTGQYNSTRYVGLI